MDGAFSGARCWIETCLSCNQPELAGAFAVAKHWQFAILVFPFAAVPIQTYPRMVPMPDAAVAVPALLDVVENPSRM